MRDPDLEAACLAQPDDDGVRLVYGDWLERHGDPRGELIAVQHALVADPRSLPLRRREGALLTAHGVDFVGVQMVPRIHLCGWRCGFVSVADLDVAMLADLLASPCGLLVEELDVWSRDTLQPAIDLLAVGRPALRELRLGRTAWRSEPVIVGALDALWAAVPNLRRLELAGEGIAFGAIHAPVLTELVVQPVVLQREQARSLDAASWPMLQRLELWFGCRYDAEHQLEPSAGDVDAAALRELLAGRAAPALEELALHNTGLGDAIVDLIVRSELAPRLRGLDLRHNGITFVGARQLATSRARFSRLQRADLRDNLFHDDHRLLESLCADVRA